MKKKKLSKETKDKVFKKITIMDIVHSLNPPRKRLSFFAWLHRYI